MIGGAAEFAAAFGVSRETTDRLERFAALLGRWQKAQNLVSPSTLNDIWARHFADSAQLVQLAPGATQWLDLGSGAGFPGMVIAILLSGTGSAKVTLVDSNQRKCAFLRAALRETGAPAVIACERIESVVERWRAPLDVVTARAVAPLGELCGMVAPLLHTGARALLQKGREMESELDEAAHHWRIDLVKHQSRIDPEGSILEICGLELR